MESPPELHAPELSVIVCTFNRGPFLENCLDHLRRQTLLPRYFEILVIDNNSTDHTKTICVDFQKAHPQMRFKYFLETRQGLSHARNRGVAESSAALISYLDDDAQALPQYAESLCRYFKDHPAVDAIGGKVTPIYESVEPPWMSRYLLPLVAAVDMGDRPGPFKRTRYPIGANMAFRRAALPEQPFDPLLGRKGTFMGSGEEKDLFQRLRATGKIIHYVPAVHVMHLVPTARTTEDYIKKMAAGIGQSEARRISRLSVGQRLAKWCQEFFKIGATLILAIYYGIRGQWPKAKMLVAFRMWFLSSFMKS